MSETDYRLLITQVKVLDTKVNSLEHVLADERASFDVLAEKIKLAEDARIAERKESQRVRMRDIFLPGLVIGGGFTDKHSFNSFIGLGWKVPLIGW